MSTDSDSHDYFSDIETCDKCSSRISYYDAKEIEDDDDIIYICKNCYCDKCGYDPKSDDGGCQCIFCEICGGRLMDSECPDCSY